METQRPTEDRLQIEAEIEEPTGIDGRCICSSKIQTEGTQKQVDTL